MSKFTPNQPPVKSPEGDPQDNFEQGDPRSLWAAWHQMSEMLTQDWRSALELAGEFAFKRMPATVENENRIDALVQRIAATDQKLAMEIEDVAISAYDFAIAKCTLIGYALAKTWPRGIEDLEGWPGRALGYAGLEDRDD